MQWLLTVRVTPRASRRKWGWDEGRQCMTCHLFSPPEDNKANKELCQYLAETLNISCSLIHIVQGHKGRIKKIAIEEKSLTLNEVLKRCGIYVQQSLI